MICNQPGVTVPVDFGGQRLNIKIDALGKKVWVCIDEQSVFRAQHLESVTIEDERDQFQKESLGSILDRQGTKKSPLMSVLIGAITRLEGTTAMLKDMGDFIVKDGHDHDHTAFDNDLDDHRAFIEELQVAGLCRELILKAQRPIETNMPKMEGAVLVYDENRTLETMVTMDADALLMFGADYKMYLRSRLWVDGTLQLIARVKDQIW